MPLPLRRLETTGRPELVGLERSVQDHFDGIRRSLVASEIDYVPGDAASWVSPAPTTIGEALDRLAAAGGVTPVP